MKKYIFTTTLLLVLVFTIYSGNCTKKTNEYTSKNRTPIYLVSEHNGRLAIFNYNSSIPITVYNVNTNTLPQKDYEKIQKGIKIYTEKGLINLINNYTS